MSKFSGIKKGDIVRIKFLEMRDLVKVRSRSPAKRTGAHYQMISEWDLGANILAFTYGGDFLVKQDAPQSGKAQELEVVNHLDGGEFEIPEEIIDSIEIVDAAHRFVSEEHKLALIMTDNDLFINGTRLENNDDDKFLDDFVTFIERYVTNRAINNSIKESK